MAQYTHAPTTNNTTTTTPARLGFFSSGGSPEPSIVCAAVCALAHIPYAMCFG